MNPSVLRRFVIYMAIATFAMFSLWAVVRYFTEQEPGDYYVRQGDIRLSDGKYDEAMQSFNLALEEMPNHRGALMGRALVFIQTGRAEEAKAELTYLIDYLEGNVGPDDPTGLGTLAAAYANRGILHDRAGAYEKALADYVQALKIDDEAVSGPSIFDKVLYGAEHLSTVRKRARYLAEQLALPEDERVLRVPELDKKQRMYKP